MHNLHFAFSRKSRNGKTGNIPVSTSDARTCPPSCPLQSVCYAKAGPLGMFWAKVNAGGGSHGRNGTVSTLTWEQLLAEVRALPEGTLWRHNQAGDLPGQGDTIDAFALTQLVMANKGRKGFTYTHKPMADAGARDDVAYANRSGFTINLSADNLTEADSLADLGIAPVVVVVSREAENHSTPKGRKVVICPAQTREGVTCKTCGLCARADREAIIGFRAHGVSAKRAEAIAAA